MVSFESYWNVKYSLYKNNIDTFVRPSVRTQKPVRRATCQKCCGFVGLTSARASNSACLMSFWRGRACLPRRRPSGGQYSGRRSSPVSGSE